MSKALEEFARRLNMAAKNKGLTMPAEICRITGQNRITVGSYMRGERMASLEACVALGKALDVSPTWLHSGKETGNIDNLMRGKKRSPDFDQETKTRGSARATDPLLASHCTAKITLFSAALPERDGSFVINTMTKEKTDAPSLLADVIDAYAVRVVGNSMEPRYFGGEIVYLHPDMPIGAGDFVVVQFAEKANEGVVRGYIKRLVSIDENTLVLAQYNPPQQLDFPRDRVLSIHKIILAAV